VAISGTLHHRIILADHNGKIRHIYGGMAAGLKDGTAAEARFSSPQGLAYTEHGLYVADTANHAIRFIDFNTQSVKTVAGNGKQGEYVRGEHDALDISLRSPWDIAYAPPMLYIAMAGSHQIWRLNTQTNRIAPYAGSGYEDILDGPLDAAAFSQPSGLSLMGDWLYVADAEDSAVRRIHLRERRVETLVGQGLFDFGDKDGAFGQALLQHVLGVAALDDNRIAIADTYNHKIKLLDLNRHTVSTWIGTGKPGKNKDMINDAKSVMLNEPGGLTIYKNGLYITDTNNHRILHYDMNAATLREWPLKP
jgi:DNA-binding beta-propeller fold protein YncE